MKAKKTKSRRGGVRERGSGSKRAVKLSFRIPPFSPAKVMKEEARYVEHRLGGALTRVGNRPMERLQWLLDFMRRDLDRLGKDDLRNLHDDFHAFTFRSGVRTSWGDLYKEGFTLEQRKKVQEEIQRIIGAVVSGQTCNYELPAKRIIGRRRKDGRVMVILTGGDLRTQVLSIMEEILKAEGHRLNHVGVGSDFNTVWFVNLVDYEKSRTISKSNSFFHNRRVAIAAYRVGMNLCREFHKANCWRRYSLGVC